MTDPTPRFRVGDRVEWLGEPATILTDLGIMTHEHSSAPFAPRHSPERAYRVTRTLPGGVDDASGAWESDLSPLE